MRLVEGKDGAEAGEEARGRGQPSALGGCGLLHRARLPLVPQEQRLLPCLLETGQSSYLLGVPLKSGQLSLNK